MKARAGNDEKKKVPESEQVEIEFIDQEVQNLVSKKGGNTKPCASCRRAIPEKACRCFICHYEQPIDPKSTDIQKMDLVKRTKAYKIYQIAIYDKEDEVPPFMTYFFKFKDKAMINSLKYNVNLCVTESARLLFNVTTATGTSREFIMAYPKLMAIIDTLPQPTQDFIRQEIKPIREETIKALKVCLKQEKMPSDGLWYLFEGGVSVVSKDKNGHKVGSLIKSCGYRPDGSFSISGEIIKSNGETFFYDVFPNSIRAYEGMKNIKDLSVRPIDKASYDELSDRGLTFEKIAQGHHYMQYCGIIYRYCGTEVTKSRISCRIMVDIKTHNNSGNPCSSAMVCNNPKNLLQQITQDERWMTYPTVPAFSFSLKVWAEFAVRDILPIQFDSKAFLSLVLPEKKKTLIRVLVEDYRKTQELLNETEKQKFEKLENENCNEDRNIQNNEIITDDYGNVRFFTDVISGKGGGCIFLLHGSPGVGKTLTAEVVCEYLEIPLYMITVGELGTTALDLEINLQKILELAGNWGCGILLDEADIFLEKRSKKDIKRNAMVGIFLRLLEYYHGVLFLTTNRLTCIDDAYSSRISVALNYHDLDQITRYSIWNNFLKETITNSEALSSLDFDKLSSYELNGRQIRSCIRLGVACARIENCPLTMKHLEDNIRLTNNFKNQFFDEKIVKKVKKISTTIM